MLKMLKSILHQKYVSAFLSCGFMVLTNWSMRLKWPLQNMVAFSTQYSTSIHWNNKYEISVSFPWRDIMFTRFFGHCLSLISLTLQKPIAITHSSDLSKLPSWDARVYNLTPIGPKYLVLVHNMVHIHTSDEICLTAHTWNIMFVLLHHDWCFTQMTFDLHQIK